MPGAPPDGPDAEAGSRRWRQVAWFAIGVSVAVIAGLSFVVLSDQASDEETQVTFRFPPDHVGPVWITVSAPDDEPRTVTITWGPYQRTVDLRARHPQICWFEKRSIEPDESSVVETVVEVTPAASVEPGHGPEPPPGAIDISDGWVLAG
jgi:hypothetical protein